MQLLASEVSADYYTRPPGIVSLLILTITFIQAMALHIHIHRVGSITIQHIQDHGHGNQCYGRDTNGKYYA